MLPLFPNWKARIQDCGYDILLERAAFHCVGLMGGSITDSVIPSKVTLRFSEGWDLTRRYKIVISPGPML